MKIVVSGSGRRWGWAVIGKDGKERARGYQYYSNKTDAKRGANRFEGELYNLFAFGPLGMPIEVEEDDLD